MLAVVVLALVYGCGGMQASRDTVNNLPDLSAEELFQVALYQARRGDFFRAEQYLVAARSQGRDEASTTYWLVRVCVSAGRYHSALRHAREHLSRNPTNWRLRFVVASIHEALGQFANAREELEGVIQLQPNRALAHYRIGMLYAQLASADDAARAHLQRYLALDPAGTHADEVRVALERLSALEVVP